MSSKEMDLTIPVVVWGNSPPKHPISCMYITDNGLNLVTGCSNGLICNWDILNGQIKAKYLFMGHKSTVTCMINVGDKSVISGSEDGVMAMWDIADGYCTNVMKLQYAHIRMQIHRKKDTSERLLFCCGYYSDILILNPYTLEVIFKLQSLVHSNWISCFHVHYSSKYNADVVLGLTVNGTIKRWTLKKDENEESCYETESKKLNCDNSVSLCYNTNCNFILLVCLHHWEIYDTNFYTNVCVTKVSNKEILQGGDFFSSNIVIVWSASGTCYFYNIYTLDKSRVNIRLFHIIKSFKECEFTVSCFKIFKNKSKYLISGGTESNISFYDLSQFDENNKNIVNNTSSLVQYWSTGNNKTFQFGKLHSEPTISLYICKLNQIILGLADGTIVIIPAIQLILNNVFNIDHATEYKILKSHKGKINALLYPNQIYPNYDKIFLVSGGSDFSVCLWNLFTGVLIHKFCVHSGEIIQLIVPPNNCKPRIQRCVCSVANDHSVSILSLTEKKCVMLASNHIFPIFSINWRPLDDFIIIECCDGSVYVWEMETGSLDRVLTGVLAQEVLDACQELDIINDQYSNPVVHFLRGVKSKSVYEVFHAAQRGLSHIQHIVLKDKKNQPINKSFPLVIDDLRFNDGSVLGQVLYLNLESIISELYLTFKGQSCEELASLNKLVDLQNLTQPGGFDLVKMVASTIERVKNETDTMQSRFQPKIEDKNKKELRLRISDTNPEESLFFIKTLTKVTLSLLHCWGLNRANDDICLSKGLLRPCFTGSFGILSYKGNLSVNVPVLDKDESSPHNIPALNISPVLVSNHLVSIASLVKTLQNIKCSFVDVDNDSWECLLHNNKLLFDDVSVQRPKIEVLALMYQNNCLEVRQVVQQLLIEEFKLLGAEKRLKLIKFWYPYLPTSKTLITGEDKNIDSNIVVFTYNKSELQVLSLVILSVIRMNFTKDKYSNDDEVFLSNCTRNVGHILHFILFNLPPHMSSSKIRRTSIDIISKGFDIWGKHLSHNKTILHLFEMCCGLDKHLPNYNPCISSVFDLSYTSHKSLLNIANTSTKIFLNVILDEINNYRIHPNPNQILDKSKTEIIFIINELIINKVDIVSEYLVHIVDVLMFCIDSSLLKLKSLNILLTNLNNYKQIHHSTELNKIGIGCKDGSIAIYEIKQLKYNLMQHAHKNVVNCVKFSPDGKILSTFSFIENTICFWHVSTTMFGFGNMHFKCIKSFNNVCERVIDNNDFGELNWVDSRTVCLSFKTGVRKTFQI